MLNFLTTTAYASAPETTTGGIGGLIVSFFPFIFIFVLMYFMMIRPQRKQQKQMQQMLASLEVGDKVVTIGGICGRISKIKDEFVWISTGKATDDATKSNIKFERSAIKSVDKKIEE